MSPLHSKFRTNDLSQSSCVLILRLCIALLDLGTLTLDVSSIDGYARIPSEVVVCSYLPSQRASIGDIGLNLKIELCGV